jgi:hypothetical protein
MTDQAVDPERVARNQLLFREINERIEDVNEAFDPSTQRYAMVCECANPGCIDQLQITGPELRAVRRTAGQFIVATDHVYPDYERIVRSHPGYQVVEKTGRAGEIARAR